MDALTTLCIGGAEGYRTPDLVTANLKRVVPLRFPLFCLVVIFT